MPIAFLCQYCGRRLEHPRSKAGQSVTCACGMATTVPRPNTAAEGLPKAQPEAAPQPADGPPIIFDCPHCRKRFRAKAAAAGKPVKCPCGMRLIVPTPNNATSVQSGAKPTQTGTVSFNCNHCRKRHTVSTDLAGQKGRCDCGLSYVVPAPSALEAKKAQAAAKAAARARAQAQADSPKAAPPKPKGEQIVFNCPRCKRRIALPVLQAGRKANCGCGARFVIPTHGGRRPVDLAAPAPAKTT